MGRLNLRQTDVLRIPSSLRTVVFVLLTLASFDVCMLKAQPATFLQNNNVYFVDSLKFDVGRDEYMKQFFAEVQLLDSLVIESATSCPKMVTISLFESKRSDSWQLNATILCLPNYSKSFIWLFNKHGEVLHWFEKPTTEIMPFVQDILATDDNSDIMPLPTRKFRAIAWDCESTYSNSTQVDTKLGALRIDQSHASVGSLVLYLEDLLVMEVITSISANSTAMDDHRSSFSAIQHEIASYISSLEEEYQDDFEDVSKVTQYVFAFNQKDSLYLRNTLGSIVQFDLSGRNPRVEYLPYLVWIDSTGIVQFSNFQVNSFGTIHDRDSIGCELQGGVGDFDVFEYDTLRDFLHDRAARRIDLDNCTEKWLKVFLKEALIVAWYSMP